MSLLPAILLLLAALRILELTIARRNTRRLLAEGAVEAGSAHYPLIIALHLAWFLALLLLVPPGRAPPADSRSPGTGCRAAAALTGTPVRLPLR